MFNITVAAGESFTAGQSKIFDLSDVNFFNSGDSLHGAGTLQIDVTSGSVKIELVARNSGKLPFSTVEGADPIVAASGTGVKLYTFSPVASPDMALRITDVSNTSSVVALVSVSLL
jgi:hypothetical protein